MCLITHEGQDRSGLGTTLNVLKWPTHKNHERNPMKFKRPENPLKKVTASVGSPASLYVISTLLKVITIRMEISTWWDINHWWKPNQVIGTTRHLLLFYNCLSIALHLLHNDLFFFWQQDLRDTLFPHHCTQINRKLGFKCPSAAEGLPDESRKTRQTCGVLVQAGTRAVSLDHPQYLSIFLQSNCAYHRRKCSLSMLKKSHAASWRVGIKCWF